MTKASIVNVVATAAINQPLNLTELGKLKEVTYNFDSYGGRVAYFKTKKMESKISIFSSGKMISAGAKSEIRAYGELKETADFLVNKGFAASANIQPSTQNIVAVAQIASNIDLEKISEVTNAIYEPEQFPGAIIRLSDPFEICVLMFASGKAVLVGLKNSRQLRPLVKKIKQLIQ